MENKELQLEATEEKEVVSKNFIEQEIDKDLAEGVYDTVHTRFGMRKISVSDDGRVLLNNKPLYQRLILDQGYWEGSGLTPPSVDAIRKDIQLTKEMGFNGARKHSF